VIDPRGLIGFAVAFLAIAWALSLVAGAAFFAARPWLRRQGPGAERGGAGLALIGPPVLGAGVVAVLIGHSALGPTLGLVDHCPAHDHHLHLCLFHGASWSVVGWAVGLVAGLALWTAVLVSHRAVRLALARWRLARIAASSVRLSGEHRDVLLAPARTAFCFVAGLRRPRIFVSTAAWQRLGEDERRAMIEHERAHAAQGDLWRRTLLGLVAMSSPSPLAIRLLAVWDAATERLCDRRAATVVGDPSPLARALVSMARSRPPAPAVAHGGLASFAPKGASEVVERVEALLAEGGDGARVARDLGRAALVALAAALIVTAFLSGPIHHGIESLLGSF
jgi:Zn-dependent protease with chaperone function